jgi:3'(2'), 5'-bisphosphate nucleotidase
MIQKITTCISEAAKAVLEIYNNSHNTITKDDGSPLTQADLISNKIITDFLSTNFNYPILSEETEDDLARLEADKVWIVDPLDGTKEFIARNGEFTINIALVEKQRPILGVISVPAKNTIYYAVKGQGAYMRKDNKDIPITCSQIKNLKDARLTVSRSHLNPQLKEVLQQHITDFIVKGSAVKYCAIAANEADASLRKTPLMEWDICAADCILTEAGGLITDFTGKKICYNQTHTKQEHGIVASNDLLHPLLLELITNLN